MSELIARRLSARAMSRAIAALRAAGLPTDDLQDGDCAIFEFRLGRAEAIGFAGMEVRGKDALLRSLVVASAFRRRGYGAAMVAAVMAEAEHRGAGTAYVLTTTAAAFFERLGFRAIARAEVPPSIAGTREFAAFCPAAAMVMRRALTTAR